MESSDRDVAERRPETGASPIVHATYLLFHRKMHSKTLACVREEVQIGRSTFNRLERGVQKNATKRVREKLERYYEMPLEKLLAPVDRRTVDRSTAYEALCKKYPGVGRPIKIPDGPRQPKKHVNRWGELVLRS